jgi:hypothetical protein
MNETSTHDVPIACDPHAVPEQMRDRWVEAGMHVYAAVLEVQEVPDGYRCRLPANSAILLTLADYISNERLCCPFLHFLLEVEPAGGPFWLYLTGGEGVQAYLQSVFETTSLLDEGVARAAGFHHATVQQTVEEALSQHRTTG